MHRADDLALSGGTDGAAQRNTPFARAVAEAAARLSISEFSWLEDSESRAAGREHAAAVAAELPLASRRLPLAGKLAKSEDEQAGGKPRGGDPAAAGDVPRVGVEWWDDALLNPRLRKARTEARKARAGAGSIPGAEYSQAFFGEEEAPAAALGDAGTGAPTWLGGLSLPGAAAAAAIWTGLAGVGVSAHEHKAGAEGEDEEDGAGNGAARMEDGDGSDSGSDSESESGSDPSSSESGGGGVAPEHLLGARLPQRTGALLERALEFWKLRMRTFDLIQHPPMVKAAAAAQASGLSGGVAALQHPPEYKLRKTKEERRKARKQARAAKREETRMLLKLGVIKPPDPKLKLSNFMRVLQQDAYLDPTAAEARARAQMQSRHEAHMAANEARRVTPAERREKKRRKFLVLKQGDSLQRVAVRLPALAHPKHRFKLDAAARQCGVGGVCLMVHGWVGNR